MRPAERLLTFLLEFPYMKKFVVLDKRIGETPLESLTAWKKLHPVYETVPATYAGRLDPMASGKLLILLGEECKQKQKYTGLDKEYVVNVLLDISTDTGDTLGLPSCTEQVTVPTIEHIREVLKAEVGTYSRTYPSYSSKTVGGVPLFLHTLRGTLSNIEVPSHTEAIHAIQLLSVTTSDLDTLSSHIEQILQRVPRDSSSTKQLGADFRQDEIREAWRALFSSMNERGFVILKLRVSCGTGSYMRTLSERIGRGLGTTALAISILRTKIGRYHTLGPFSFFFPSL